MVDYKNDFEERVLDRTDKITAISEFVKDFEMSLAGYKWNGTKYVYSGDVLLDSQGIQMASSLLRPFAKEQNLISYGDPDIWNEERYRTLTKFNDFLETDIGCRAENQKIILEQFHNTLQAIGKIINNSRTYLPSLLHPENNYENEDKKSRGTL